MTDHLQRATTVVVQAVPAIGRRERQTGPSPSGLSSCAADSRDCL